MRLGVAPVGIEPADTFASWFNRFLEANELTIENVHDATGISVGAISNYKRGIRTPDVQQCEILANFARVPVTDLMRLAQRLSRNPKEVGDAVSKLAMSDPDFAELAQIWQENPEDRELIMRVARRVARR